MWSGSTLQSPRDRVKRRRVCLNQPHLATTMNNSGEDPLLDPTMSVLVEICIHRTYLPFDSEPAQHSYLLKNLAINHPMSASSKPPMAQFKAHSGRNWVQTSPTPLQLTNKFRFKRYASSPFHLIKPSLVHSRNTLPSSSSATSNNLRKKTL
jgi:hypothetical protein